MGWPSKRNDQAQLGSRKAQESRDMRSLIFTDAALDYLVHLHLLRNGHKPGIRPLSFKAFMDTLRQIAMVIDSGCGAGPGMDDLQ